MLRYLALAWDAQHPGSANNAAQLARRVRRSLPSWQETFCGRGIQVFHTGASLSADKPHRLHDDAGVIVGTLFQRGAGSNFTRAQPSLDEAATRELLRTAGRELITSSWGRYVAFIVDPETGRKWVLRDPMGGLPCFQTEIDGVAVFFSLLQDALCLGLPARSINWRYMTTRAAIGPFHTDQTAVNDVSELRPGECLELARSRINRQLYWDPQAIAESNPIEDAQRAAVELRATTKACVHAWSSCHESLLHRLSGGLDSSIVMGCLQDAPAHPRITSHVHYHPKFPQCDPREYARLSAARAGCELLEQDRSESNFRFEELLNNAPTAKPLPHLAHLEYSAFERRLAEEKHATAVFSGDGGDPLFCRFGKELVVADYMLKHGIRPHAFTLASRMAPLVQASVWGLLASSIRYAYFRRSLDANQGIASPRDLITEDARQRAAHMGDHLHPWFRARQSCTPGKLLHARLVLYSQQPHYMPGAETGIVDEIHPLLSQPLVELSLSIPTYVHLANGRERGLARQAFAPDVPSRILNRFWKGRAGELPKEQLMKRAAYVRELLLDGQLVREGILDARKVEEALSGRPTTHGGSVMEIFDHIISESWLKAWTSAARQAVA